jgi:gliding motility-associated-like protein
VNDSPVAVNDSGITNEDTPITLVSITANDTDVDGTVDAGAIDLDPLTGGVQNTFSSSEGIWTVNANGDVTLTPALNFNGIASRNYTVNDNSSAVSNAATIMITVNAVNDLPAAVNDSGTTDEDIPVTIVSIAANDTDVDGTVDIGTVDLDPLIGGVQNTFSSPAGVWNVNVNGDVTLAPTLNFNGTASKTYTVNDDSGASSNSATITIIINSVNDSPVAGNDNGTTDEDTPVTLIGITANDTDVDGTVDAGKVDIDPLTSGMQNIFNKADGGWNVNANGDVTFTPALNFNGVTSLNYTTNDDSGAASNVAVVTVTVATVNDEPVLKDINVTTHRNVSASGTVFDNSDIDPDGTSLSVNINPLNTPDHGSMTINSDGTFNYTPSFNFVGTDLAEVEICDNGLPLPGACASKIMTVTVNPINSRPLFIVNGVAGDSLTAKTSEDTPVVFCFETVDPDGDNITLGTLTNISGGGTLEVYGNIQFCFQFTPAPDYDGISTWEIEVCDNGSPSLCSKLIATMIISPVNDPPVGVIDTIYVLRNVPSPGDVLLNDYDVDGDALTVTTTAINNASHGEAMLNSDGSFTYISDLTFRGIDSLVYQVCDSANPAGCSEGTLIIIVDDLPLKVYEGVTPNGDGNNDYLRIDQIDYYTDNEVLIFDQFNNLVFQVRGYNNADRVWRGQANKGIGRSELPEGTYFYNIYLGQGGRPLKGFVILKRN